MFKDFSQVHKDNAKNILMKYFEELKLKNSNLVIDGYASNYFIFSQDILYFHSVKLNDKRHGWSFGIWAEYDNKNDIIGCTYIGEANEFFNKFKPSYTNISETKASIFLAKVKKLELNPKQGLIDEYFTDENDYNEYWAKKEAELHLRNEMLSFMKEKIPKLAKEANLGLRGIAIVDENWRSAWCTSPRYKLYGWESCKQANSIDEHEYWKQFDEKIINTYHKALEDKFSVCDSWIRRDYMLGKYGSRVWTQQDAMCSLGRYITFFESPFKQVKHPRKHTLATLNSKYNKV